jgi:hypothetical protein
VNVIRLDRLVRLPDLADVGMRMIARPDLRLIVGLRYSYVIWYRLLACFI